MDAKKLSFLLILILIFSIFLKLERKERLEVFKTKVPPVIDGEIDDVWNDSKPLKLKLLNHHTKKYLDLEVRALHDEKKIYFLFEWMDKSESVKGKRIVDLKKLTTKNGDETEDMFALIWNLNNSIERFNQRGCWDLCHGDVDSEQYMNTRFEGEYADEWVWMASGSIEDRWMDNTADPLNIHIAHHLDEAMNLKGKAKWKEGKWILEIERSLQTQDYQDIQFYTNIGRVYYFTISAFDDSIGRYKSISPVQGLVFKSFVPRVFEFDSFWFGIFAFFSMIILIFCIYHLLKGSFPQKNYIFEISVIFGFLFLFLFFYGVFSGMNQRELTLILSFLSGFFTMSLAAYYKNFLSKK
ncbi:MAG: ethylbenzene dehydrogenase-related protein, partial [Candidatus Methanofastidiosia archaeon]